MIMVNGDGLEHNLLLDNSFYIKLVEKELTIEFREPFLPRRGRINCSVNDNGKWRWFGTQFIIR